MAKKISVDHRNISEFTVSFFQMDIELLFSTNAFSLQQLSQFSFVKPNKTLSINFPQQTGTNSFDIPQELSNANMMITLESAGQQKSHAFYSHSLNVHVFENSGQLKVADKNSDKALSKVYVKVYAQIGSLSQFWKDGYTDLRGRFDYATKNGADYAGIIKFGILILSDTHGAVTKEVAPPKI